MVVSNTSPIINLAAVGRIDLLRELFGEIHIPEAVYHEVSVVGAGMPGSKEVRDSDWIVTCPVNDRRLVDALCVELDVGEAEAIALAIERDASLVLLDERYGRSVAERFSVPLMGILGVLTQAKRRGLVPALKPVLNNLRDVAGFRIGMALERRVLEAVGEG